jgi:nucleotide-binding universal stress UspA family protein
MTNKTDRGPGKIVVGVDGSPSSEHALLWAARQAQLMAAELHAVIAWNFPSTYGWTPVVEDIDWAESARSVLEQAVDNALGRGDAEKVHQHVVDGHPAPALLDAATDADLLVVGSRGHGGFTGMLLGSVSQHVVTHARCPVVVVHHTASDQTRA